MSIKVLLKQKYNIDIKDVVERVELANVASRKRANFDYDVSGLPAFTDNTLPDIKTDLIANSDFLADLTLETGIKGTREIALLNANVVLKAKVGCTTSPDGAVVFTDKALTTVLLQAGVEFCNEDLNGKMTQILNTLGTATQNGQLPADLETILMAYLTKLLARKAQRVVILGDTTSLDAELALFDGLVKKIEADATVANFTSGAVAITAANAYGLAYGVFKAINPELMDNGMPVTLFMGRSAALFVLESWNAANPYTQVSVPAGGTSMRFTLPLTDIEVRTLPELNGLDKMFAIPMSLAYLGVDLESDMELVIKYDDYNDKLKAEASFRLGTEFIFGKYFTELILA